MAENEELRERSENGASAGVPDISATIDKLLANPELINMVASAIGKSAPRAVADGEEKTPVDSEVEISAIKPTSSSTDVISTLAPVLAALKGGNVQSEKADRRACLLGALKPYLCKERCDAIDYMIKLGRISELLKNMS